MPERSIGGFGVVEPEWHEVFQGTTKSLAKKPTKNRLVGEYHTTISTAAVWIIFSGIAADQVKKYTLEAWSTSSIRTLHTWLSDEMLPAIQALKDLINTQSVDYWKDMFNFNPRHGDIKMLEKYKDNVRRVWWSRPRFKLEAGRAKEKGY